MLRRISKPALILVAAFILGTCSTSPTGRSQVLILGDDEMNEMGAEAFAEIKKQTPIERDPRINAYVNCIAEAILAVTEDDTGVTSWETVVFRDNSANAFALPGGKIGVHTGILPVAKNADQLASVMGHEVGHVIARHGNERVSQNAGIQAVVGAVGGVTGNETVAGAIGAGAQFGVLLPFSRAHESEADVIGQQLMARAGFNPQGAIDLWKNMAALSDGAPPEFMSTHPSHDTRIKDLESKLPENMLLYEQAKASGRNPNCRL